MLGKIIKYELKGLLRPMLIIIAILVGTCLLSILLTPLTMYFDGSQNEIAIVVLNVSLIMSILLYSLAAVCCGVGIYLLIAVRFFKTCYKDQGYLTHTLPVSTHELLLGKIIGAFIYNIIYCIVSLLCTFLMINVLFDRIASIIDIPFVDIYESIYITFSEFFEQVGMNAVLFILYFILTIIVSAIFQNIIIFGSISLGQMYKKHPVLGAILAYYITTTIIGFISYITTLLTYIPMITNSVKKQNLSVHSFWNISMFTSICIQIIVGIAVYFINYYMITKKLNLE